MDDTSLISFEEVKEFDIILDSRDETFINQVVVLDALAFTHSRCNSFLIKK